MESNEILSEVVEMSEERWLRETRRVAWEIRSRSVAVTEAADGAYLCQSCSAAEILAVLHVDVLEHERDLFILSPTHYSLAVYATLVATGELPADALRDYNQDGSRLEMIGSEGAPGILVTGGSLAQSLSQAIGLGLARRRRGVAGRVFVLLSDGELQEGQTWEAMMSLAHFGLREVVVVIDANDSQVDGSPKEIMGIEPIVDRLRAFGLDAVEVDGHDPVALRGALTVSGAPRVVVARTRMWQGLPSLRGRHNLHFIRFRPGEAQRARADLDRAVEGVTI